MSWTDSRAFSRFTCHLLKPASMRTRDENKQDNLIRAVIKLTNELGYNNISIAKIAKEAGVSPATLYIYYENREDMFIQIYREINTLGAVYMYQGIRETTPLYDAVVMLCANLIRFINECNEEFRFLEQSHNLPLIRQHQNELLNNIDARSVAVSKPFFNILGHGISRGILKPLTPILLVGFISSTVISMHKILSGLPKSTYAEGEGMEDILDMIWDGILVHSDSAPMYAQLHQEDAAVARLEQVCAPTPVVDKFPIELPEGKTSFTLNELQKEFKEAFTEGKTSDYAHSSFRQSLQATAQAKTQPKGQAKATAVQEVSEEGQLALGDASIATAIGASMFNAKVDANENQERNENQDDNKSQDDKKGQASLSAQDAVLTEDSGEFSPEQLLAQRRSYKIGELDEGLFPPYYSQKARRLRQWRLQPATVAYFNRAAQAAAEFLNSAETSSGFVSRRDLEQQIERVQKGEEVEHSDSVLKKLKTAAQAAGIKSEKIKLEKAKAMIPTRRVGHRGYSQPEFVDDEPYAQDVSFDGVMREVEKQQTHKDEVEFGVGEEIVFDPYADLPVVRRKRKSRKTSRENLESLDNREKKS